MKLIDLIEILLKLEKTPSNRYADVYVQVGDNVIDLTDASFEVIEDDKKNSLVLYTEQIENDIS